MKVSAEQAKTWSRTLWKLAEEIGEVEDDDKQPSKLSNLLQYAWEESYAEEKRARHRVCLEAGEIPHV